MHENMQKIGAMIFDDFGVLGCPKFERWFLMFVSCLSYFRVFFNCFFMREWAANSWKLWFCHRRGAPGGVGFYRSFRYLLFPSLLFSSLLFSLFCSPLLGCSLLPFARLCSSLLCSSSLVSSLLVSSLLCSFLLFSLLLFSARLYPSPSCPSRWGVAGTWTLGVLALGRST